MSRVSHSGTQSHTGERRIGFWNITVRDTCISVQNIAVWDCPVWKIVIWKCHVWDLYNVVIIIFFQSLGWKVLKDYFWSSFCAFYVSGVKCHKTIYRFYSFLNSLATTLYPLLYSIYMYYYYIRFICEFGRFNFLVGLRNITRFNGRLNTSKRYLGLC